MSSLHVQCDFVSQLRRFKVQCIARQDDPPWSAKRLSSNFATSPVREVRGDTLKRRRGERSAASDGCRFINPTSGYKIETGSGSSSTKQRGLFEIEEREEDIYERYFFGKDHWNFFTTEPDIGPVVLSLKQEAGISREHFRLIVRSSSSFLHGHLPASSLSANRYSKEDVVTALSREMGFVSTFKQASNLRSFSDELLKMDQSFVKRDLKIGVIYLKEGQATEEEIFTNKEASPAFNNFLGLLGDRVKLKGFAHFRGGLDTTSQQTGDESVYTEWRGHRMMYHVSTLLPNIGKSSEQLIQRKRHIGNDIVCVVFVDGKDTRFDPTSIRSHFLHTYVAVCPFLDDGRLKYKVGVVSREGVPFYKPNLIDQDIFEHDDYFREFLLSKIINAEHACLRSPRFAGLQERTLRQMMSNLILTAEDSQDNGSGKLVLSDEMAKRGSWMPLGCVGPPSPFLDCRRERLEFVDRLSSDLHTAFLDKDLCDVVFVVGDDHMPVYGIKAVLAARSKVLKDVFLRSPVPSPRPSRSTSISRARRKSSSPVPGIIHSTSAAELRSSQSKTSPSPSISSGSDLDRKEKKSLRQKLKAKLQRGSTRATINVSLVRVDNREENEDSRAMLSQTGKTTEGREVIFLYGFEMAEFSRVIEYLHTGCCRMTPLTLPGLVSLAEYLDLTDLQQACFDRLSDAVCMDTVCDVLSSLGRYMSFQSAQTLFERTCEFIDDHPQEFFSHPGVLQLPKKIFGKIMERELEVPEILKFTTCLAWGETNCHPADLKEEVSSLVSNIHLYLISAVDLIKVVVPSGTIPNDKIMMALAYHADPKAVEGSTLARSARRTRTKRELKQQCELARKSEVVLRRQPRNQLTCDTDSSPSAVSTDSQASSGSVVESPRQWSLFVLPLDREEDSEVGDINKSRSQDMGVVCDRFGNGGEVEVSTDI